MPRLPRILFTMLLMLPLAIANAQGQEVRVDFYKDPFTVKVDRSVLVNLPQQLSADVIKKVITPLTQVTTSL